MILKHTRLDVAPILDFLDPCEACGGDGRFEVMPAPPATMAIRSFGCRACDGTGKALHVDRVTGALRRLLWEHNVGFAEDHSAPGMRIELEVFVDGFQHMGNTPTTKTDHGLWRFDPDPEEQAITWCQVVYALKRKGVL